MRVKSGIYWTVYGTQEVEIPDEYKDSSDEDIQEYIESIWDEISLPTDADYSPGSDEPDFEYFERLDEEDD